MSRKPSSSGSWSSTPRLFFLARSCSASEVVLQPDDVGLVRSADPELHHPARPAARANGDDLEASGGAMGVRPEFPPRPDLFRDPFSDFEAGPVRRFDLSGRP